MIRGNLKEATKQFEAWQERSEVQSGQSWTYAEYNLGMIAMFEGDHAMALKKFESILQEPKAKIAIAKIHLNAKIAIAKIHLRLGNYDKTRELMERIAEEHPDYSIAPLFEFP